MCVSCGHSDNGDINAAKVIKQRAIQLMLNAGTELSKRGVLFLSDNGRGDNIRRTGSLEPLYSVSEASKNKVALATGSPYALA